MSSRHFAHPEPRRELDILVLGAVFPPYCSVTAKKSLKYWPILGWFSTFIYYIFLGLIWERLVFVY